MSGSRPLSGHDGDGSVGRLRPEHVRAVRFRTSTFRAGYDQDEVDDFLDLIDTALRSTSSTRRLSSSDVIHKKFTRTRLRTGYDIDDVDSFLEQVADELSRDP